jgi:hypothetical protein
MSPADHRDKNCVLLSDWLANPRIRLVALTLYYMEILTGQVVLYGAGEFATPPFVYQNF